MLPTSAQMGGVLLVIVLASQSYATATGPLYDKALYRAQTADKESYAAHDKLKLIERRMVETKVLKESKLAEVRKLERSVQRLEYETREAEKYKIQAYREAERYEIEEQKTGQRVVRLTNELQALSKILAYQRSQAAAAWSAAKRARNGKGYNRYVADARQADLLVEATARDVRLLERRLADAEIIKTKTWIAASAANERRSVTEVTFQAKREALANTRAALAKARKDLDAATLAYNPYEDRMRKAQSTYDYAYKEADRLWKEVNVIYRPLRVQPIPYYRSTLVQRRVGGKDYYGGPLRGGGSSDDDDGGRGRRRGGSSDDDDGGKGRRRGGSSDDDDGGRGRRRGGGSDDDDGGKGRGRGGSSDDDDGGRGRGKGGSSDDDDGGKGRRRGGSSDDDDGGRGRRRGGSSDDDDGGRGRRRGGSSDDDDGGKGRRRGGGSDDDDGGRGRRRGGSSDDDDGGRGRRRGGSSDDDDGGRGRRRGGGSDDDDGGRGRRRGGGSDDDDGGRGRRRGGGSDDDDGGRGRRRGGGSDDDDGGRGRGRGGGSDDDDGGRRGVRINTPYVKGPNRLPINRNVHYPPHQVQNPNYYVHPNTGPYYQTDPYYAPYTAPGNNIHPNQIPYDKFNRNLPLNNGYYPRGRGNGGGSSVDDD